MKRALTPSLNPTGLGSAAAAVYAAMVMIWNATHHQGVIDPQVIVAALGAAAFLYARFKVTPVADPKDGNGNALQVARPAPSAADAAAQRAAGLLPLHPDEPARYRAPETLTPPSGPAPAAPPLTPPAAGM